MNYGFDQFSRKQMEKEQAFPTFYQSMKLDYPGKTAQIFQAEELKQPIASVTKQAVVTLPNSFTGNELTSSITGDGMEGELTYRYEDWYVGSGSISLSPLVYDLTLPFERKLDV